MTLILASASPRRTAMLTQMGLSHTVLPADIDETPVEGESPEELVVRLAKEKAAAAFSMLDSTRTSDAVVLAADTLIALDGISLGKPADRNECRDMLKSLSGRQHSVLTAISVKSQHNQTAQLIETFVQFAPVSDAEIHAYWATGEPVDKAGSYAIQGIGGQFVQSVSGSVSAVIGLPLYETKVMLREFGVTV